MRISRIDGMIMKKIMISASLVLSASLAAQNLDPTVEVSREYEGKLIEVHKPALTMSVPDTLHRFDLDFDYSVFDNPYKGSYEFSPYAMEMMPSSSGKASKTFYLRAGAGYTLHPVLDVLWSPLRKKAFSMDLYATHRSYVGGYRAVGQRPSWKGYDLLTKAGADFGYDWKKAVMDFGASYNGVADKDYRGQRAFNALDAYARVKSKSLRAGNFSYDVGLTYRFAEDNARRIAGMPLSEHDFGIDVSFGPDFKKHKVLFDLGVDMVSYAGTLTSTTGRFWLIPHYLYEKGLLELDLGVRVSAAISSGTVFTTGGQFVYPDLHMNLDLIPDALRLYFHIGGGERLNTYSSLIDSNHHVDFSYGLDGYASLMDVTVERVSAVAGLAGRITNFFSYDLSGGYINYGNALLDAALKAEDGLFRPGVGYSPYQKAFVSLDCGLNVRNFCLDAVLGYVHAWGIHGASLMSPSSFEGNVSLTYGWRKRINAGIDCDFASARTSAVGFRMPGYADLGICAEYVSSRRLSFWIRGGNLLDMEIQRNLMYAEKGINFTAGICLSL